MHPLSIETSPGKIIKAFWAWKSGTYPGPCWYGLRWWFYCQTFYTALRIATMILAVVFLIFRLFYAYNSCHELLTGSHPNMHCQPIVLFLPTFNSFDECCDNLHPSYIGSNWVFVYIKWFDSTGSAASPGPSDPSSPAASLLAVPVSS